jgi:hypothetical protein
VSLSSSAAVASSEIRGEPRPGPPSQRAPRERRHSGGSGCRPYRRVGARSPRRSFISYRDGSCKPGLAAVGRLVGRAPAASPSNVCFPSRASFESGCRVRICRVHSQRWWPGQLAMPPPPVASRAERSDQSGPHPRLGLLSATVSADTAGISFRPSTKPSVVGGSAWTADMSVTLGKTTDQKGTNVPFAVETLL